MGSALRLVGAPEAETRTKVCRKCGHEKLASEFYRQPVKTAMGDGLRGRCKACHNAATNGVKLAAVREKRERDARAKLRVTDRTTGESWPARGYKLGLVLPDLHLPREDKRAVSAVESLLADETFDYWVCLGDFLDNEGTSQHNRDKARIRSSPQANLRFGLDYGREWLERHLGLLRATSPGVECHMIQGNHDENLERYVDQHPELDGMVNDLQRELQLEHLGVSWHAYWTDKAKNLLRIGRLAFGHGEFVSQYHAARHAIRYGCPIVYGHTHTLQTHYMARLGSEYPIAAWSLGCLCDFDQPWRKGSPHGWQHAFGIVQWFPDGMFQVNPVPIFDGRFISPTNGKVYGA